MSLYNLIVRAIDLKKGNTEFALFRLDKSEWDAHIGNPSPHVMLGEVSGHFNAEGDTPEAALLALIAKLEAA